MSCPSSPTTIRHIRILLAGTLLSRLYIAALVVISSSVLPLFDSSPTVIVGDSWISSFLRWDAFYFAHIAEEGYVYEHEWAFFPGIPLLMRFASRLIPVFNNGAYARQGWQTLLLGGALATIACDSTSTLYHLSRYHLGSSSLAFVSTALSLLPSSPSAMRFAAYTEPIFTFLSYRGMLYCTRFQWLLASLCFALASAFRSNGIMLGGFIVWGMLVEPYLHKESEKLSSKRILYAISLTTLPILPFAYHNYMGYLAFCTSTSGPSGWCTRLFPSIYAHVQEKYWDVGFLRYWTLQQLPNFVISFPVLLNILAFAYFYFPSIPAMIFTFDVSSRGRTVKPLSPFLSSSLIPHTIYAALLTLILIFSAHTQIALRLLPAVPVTYWAAARLLYDHPAWGKGWVAWSVVWGSLSTVLWAVFLPPA